MLFDRWFKKSSLSFNLDGNGIDGASEWLAEKLTEMDVTKSDRLRARLLFEEALLDLAEHFGAEQQANAFVELRFGRARLRLLVEGEQFNLLGLEHDAARDEYSISFFSVLGLRTQYSYELGKNVLRISLPQKSMNLVLKIGIAIAVGILVGIIGNTLVPDALQETISNTVLTPLANMWIRLLQAISGPVIFLTALTGTMSMKRVTEFGGSRLSTIARYFTVGALAVVFAMTCSLPIFSPDVDPTQASSQVLGSALDQILQIVPENLIAPFLTANTLQLLLIAIVTGVILGALDTQVAGLNSIIRQLNVVGLTVAQHACSLVPIFVGLLLCLKIWTHDIELLGSIWVPLALAAAISAAVLLLTNLITSARMHVSPLLLARKLKGPFVKTLKKGTLDFTSVDDLADSCKRLLGVNEEFAKATLPQGLFLYMPTSGIGIFVFVLFAAKTQQLDIDQAWLLSAAVLSVVLAVATPPLTGANLLSFIVAFTYLGIQDGAMLDVMIFDIVFGELCIAMDQAMLQLETIRQAKHMGFLDEDVLRAPLDSPVQAK